MTWTELCAWMTSRFEIIEKQPASATLRFELDGGRQQFVRVVGSDDSEWVQIISPIAHVSEADVAHVLADAWSSHLVGGVVSIDGVLHVRHTIRAADSAVDQVELFVHAVVHVADELERRVSTADRF